MDWSFPFLCPGRRVKVFPQSVPGQGQAAAGGALPRTRQRRRENKGLFSCHHQRQELITQPSHQPKKGRRYSRQRPERRRQPKQTRGGRTASDRDDADSKSEQACMLAGRALIRHACDSFLDGLKLEICWNEEGVKDPREKGEAETRDWLNNVAPCHSPRWRAGKGRLWPCFEQPAARWERIRAVATDWSFPSSGWDAV